MRISLKTLIASIEGNALPKFANDGSLPIKTTFRLNKIWKAALDEFKAFNESRTKLCEQYGTLDEDKTEYAFQTPAKRKAFDEEFKSLLEVEVDIPGEPFTLADLGPRKITSSEFLSAQDFLALEWLIVDEAEEAPKKKAAGK